MRIFRDRVAVVTGGASGIGRALALRFAREGVRMVVGDVEQAAIDRAIEELQEAGVEATGVRCDVAQYEQVEALAAAAYDRFGAVHILCNNAGVNSAPANSWMQSDADWRWVLGVNLWGVIHGIRAFVPRMLKQDTEGHIVNTGSISGLISMPFGGPNNAAKFGVMALSEVLHHELAISGAKLRVSVVCPAWVRTDILDCARHRPSELQNDQPTEVNDLGIQAAVAGIRQGIPPEAVADLVFNAVRDEQFYVWTHPEYKLAVRLRMENILEERNPSLGAPSTGGGDQAQKTA